MSDSYAAKPLSKTPWTILLPWLDEYRAGPGILASNELIPNAWLDGSPADALNAENFGRFCELVALRHLKDRADTTLADDFGVLSPSAPLSMLALGRHGEKALQHNGIETVGDILAHSANSLTKLPQVGRATVVEVVAGLVGDATRVPSGPDERIGGRVLADANLIRFIESVDERDQIILHERIFAEKPRTQADLAKQMGLSRERVNQLDRTLRLQLSETVDSSLDLRRLLAETVALADPLADAGRVAEALPLFATEIPALGITIGALLIAGSNELAFVNGWIVSRSPAQIADLVGEILDAHAGDESLVPIRAVATRLNLTDAEAVRWLTSSGYTIIDEYVVNGSTSTGDLVCAVLSIAGTPRTFDEIVAGLAGEPRSRSSVRNALVTDDRVVKTDRTTYGLRRWGGDKYLPVHRQIGRILDANDGKIRIAELVALISEKYDVTESSIRAYAGAGEFVTRDEVVTRRSERYVHRKSPAKTRGLYRDGDTIRWATTVGSAHLKGSAFNIPSALAGLLGVGPGSPVQLPSRLGTQSLMWVSVQARVGTIKRFVTDLELTQGEPIFLEFTAEGFDVKRQVTDPSGDPIDRIFAAMGAEPRDAIAQTELRELLAAALFLPDDSDAATVLSTLTHRKETELTELVAAVLN